MVKEMTTGNSLKQIIAFCIPMIFGNIFQQLYSMVDTIIVGKFVGVDALAGVGSTGAINFLIIGFSLGICSGFAINIAQSFGAGDLKEMRKYVANAMYLSIVVVIILTVLTMLTTRSILIITKTPENIFQYAYDFIIIIFAGIFATVFYNMLSSILRALGDSRTPLIFLLLSSVVNVVLDLIFIIKFDMGVKGAGYATVIAQFVAALLCLIYIRRRFDILRFEKDELAFDVQKCKKLLSIGVPMALQFSITAVGSIILQSAVNSLGSSVVAAVTAANKIQTMLVQPLETLGLTMATYCGQNLGAKRYDRIKKGIRQSIVMSIIYSIAAGIAVTFLGRGISLLFIDSSEIEILDLSSKFLSLNALFYIILGILFILRNAMQGMGFSLLPMMAGVSELFARSIVSFGFVAMFGFNAICLAGPTAWIFADIILIAAYFYNMKKLRISLGVESSYTKKKHEQIPTS